MIKKLLHIILVTIATLYTNISLCADPFKDPNRSVQKENSISDMATNLQIIEPCIISDNQQNLPQFLKPLSFESSNYHCNVFNHHNNLDAVEKYVNTEIILPLNELITEIRQSRTDIINTFASSEIDDHFFFHKSLYHYFISSTPDFLTIQPYDEETANRYEEDLHYALKKMILTAFDPSIVIEKNNEHNQYTAIGKKIDATLKKLNSIKNIFYSDNFDKNTSIPPHILTPLKSSNIKTTLSYAIGGLQTKYQRKKLAFDNLNPIFQNYFKFCLGTYNHCKKNILQNSIFTKTDPDLDDIDKKFERFFYNDLYKLPSTQENCSMVQNYINNVLIPAYNTHIKNIKEKDTQLIELLNTQKLYYDYDTRKKIYTLLIQHKLKPNDIADINENFMNFVENTIYEEKIHINARWEIEETYPLLPLLLKGVKKIDFFTAELNSSFHRIPYRVINALINLPHEKKQTVQNLLQKINNTPIDAIYQKNRIAALNLKSFLHESYQELIKAKQKSSIENEQKKICLEEEYILNDYREFLLYDGSPELEENILENYTDSSRILYNRTPIVMQNIFNLNAKIKDYNKMPCDTDFEAMLDLDKKHKHLLHQKIIKALCETKYHFAQDDFSLKKRLTRHKKLISLMNSINKSSKKIHPIIYLLLFGRKDNQHCSQKSLQSLLKIEKKIITDLSVKIKLLPKNNELNNQYLTYLTCQYNVPKTQAKTINNIITMINTAKKLIFADDYQPFDTYIESKELREVLSFLITTNKKNPHLAFIITQHLFNQQHNKLTNKELEQILTTIKMVIDYNFKPSYIRSYLEHWGIKPTNQSSSIQLETLPTYQAINSDTHQEIEKFKEYINRVCVTQCNNKIKKFNALNWRTITPFDDPTMDSDNIIERFRSLYPSQQSFLFSACISQIPVYIKEQLIRIQKAFDIDPDYDKIEIKNLDSSITNLRTSIEKSKMLTQKIALLFNGIDHNTPEEQLKGSYPPYVIKTAIALDTANREKLATYKENVNALLNKHSVIINALNNYQKIITHLKTLSADNEYMKEAKEE